MLTNKITGFSADLLNTVRGILGEAKKCPADCECEKCEAEEMKEGSMPTADEPTDANKKTADKVRAMLAKEKKLKEDIMEMVNEASDGLADKAKKSGISLSTLKKVYARGIAAWNSGHRPGTTPQQWAHARVNSYITKGKGTYHGADKDLRSEGTDMPFEGPYKKVGEREDEYGNKVKNVAKYLAKKAMNKQKNEEAEHNNCGTPECCGQCDTATQIDETAKIVAHLQKRYGDNIRKSHVRSAANDFGVDASKLAKAVRTKLGKTSLAEDEQIDEVSKATLGRYINKAKDSIDTASYRQGHKEAHGSSSKALEKKLTKRHKGISTAVNKLTKEDAEQIDELSKGTMGRYINKAADRMSTQGVTAGLKIATDEKSKKNFDNITKRQKGISTAVSKLTKEEEDFVDSLNDADIEQIDELSKDAMLKYLSANKKSDAAAQEKGDYSKSDKRMRGADMAVRKYTARDTKYVRVPATEETQIDEISKGTAMKALQHVSSDPDDVRGYTLQKKIGKKWPEMKGHAADASYTAGYGRSGKNIFQDRDKLADRAKTSYRMTKDGKANKQDLKARFRKEEIELDEARGRPRKAGAKDFTIHPKTKEKLMHNNPEHMKKIEVLQKNGILEKPKVEAGQHIMNQLRKAKTSMLGGSKINFTHGDSKEVSGTHAAKILTKYAGMKPDEKENFQKFVGHSHENLMKHV